MTGAVDGLFPAPSPDHPDAEVAREEITRYYKDRVAEARAVLAKVQAELDEREAAQAGWLERGEIKAEGIAGTIRMEAPMIAADSMRRYQKAATDAIYHGGDHAEAQRLGERETALRRWLTAAGYDLGALAEPAPKESRGRSTRRG